MLQDTVDVAYLPNADLILSYCNTMHWAFPKPRIRSKPTPMLSHDVWSWLDDA